MTNRLRVSPVNGMVIAVVAMAVLIVAWAFIRSEPFPGGRGARLVYRERARSLSYEVYELVRTPRIDIETALEAEGYVRDKTRMRTGNSVVTIRDGAYISVTDEPEVGNWTNVEPKPGFVTVTIIREDKSFFEKLIDRILSR